MVLSHWGRVTYSVVSVFKVAERLLSQAAMQRAGSCTGISSSYQTLETTQITLTILKLLSEDALFLA